MRACPGPVEPFRAWLAAARRACLCLCDSPDLSEIASMRQGTLRRAISEASSTTVSVMVMSGLFLMSGEKLILMFLK